MSLLFLPDRTSQPREIGLTMMMDKGLSTRQMEDFLTVSSSYTDLIKFGFGTSLISKNIKEKVSLMKQFGIVPYLGGTMFELFYARNQITDYFNRPNIDKYSLLEKNIKVSSSFGVLNKTKSINMKYFSSL